MKKYIRRKAAAAFIALAFLIVFPMEALAEQGGTTFGIEQYGQDTDYTGWLDRSGKGGSVISADPKTDEINSLPSRCQNAMESTRVPSISKIAKRLFITFSSDCLSREHFFCQL